MSIKIGIYVIGTRYILYYRNGSKAQLGATFNKDIKPVT
jgi:hypothetical protein